MSKTVILDSYPTASINFPSYVPLNTTPPLFPRKHKGQPLLGQRQAKYTHFIPMRDESSEVKNLLTVADTETSAPETIQGYDQLLKVEKVLTGEAKSSSGQKGITDANFKKEAKEYVQTPNTYSEDRPESRDDAETICQKNDSHVATIIAAAAKPKPRVSRPKASKSKASKKPRR